MPGTFVPSHYLPILLFVVIGVGFAVATLIIGYVLRPSRPYREKLMAYESGVDPFGDARLPFPVRYYVICMLFVLFDIEAVFLFPWAVSFETLGLVGLVEMVLFIAILFVGYVYAWKKGALEWD
ncbi:MAG: NADH-quinone oxidoreductase subunit A [Nitrospirota bacterium]